MRWFKNLKIGMKLALGFGVILVLLIFIALFASFTANNIDSIYSDVIDFPVERRANWVEVENRYNSIRSSVYHVGFDIGEETHEASSASLIEMYNSDFALINTAIDKIKQSLTNDKTLTADERARKIGEADGIIQSINQWRENLTDPMILALQAEDNAAAIKAYDENSSLSTDLMSKIESYRDESATVAADRNTATTAQSQQSIRLLLLLSAITAVLGIALAVIITRTIANPVKALVKTVNDVSEGKLEVSIDQSKIYKDEIGVLSASVSRLIGIILLIVSQLDKLNKDFQNGDIKANIDESLFKGSFKEVADGVNYMFSTMVGEILNFIDALNEFGKGNIDVKIANANGRTTVMVNTLDGLREHLTDVTNEINSLVNSAAIGQLDKRIDTKNFGGDWVILFDGLNALMEVISAPINEASEIMEKVAAGNFENKVTGNYQGAFLKIKESLNNTITNISSYIEEISAVLDKIAKNNLDQNISREYVGDFSDIKESLNNIIKTFNGIVSNILMAAEQVSSGSTSVSEGSMSLAEGATEQAASIQELNATVQLINSNTVRNAENAENANSLSVQSKESASQGETEMKKMLHSMERIKESSSGISKIMKVIDDIAFQTNLLALNAAVEAARAGEYGKGFAVVAQEVRTLAERSKSNANETYRLIEESITRINEGMEIARNTDTSLGLIVESVSKVNDIIAGISTSSQEQASAISQVTEGIQQIAEVIQGNSATSEETASAAQELSGQAEMLKGLVEVFTLKRENK